MKLNEQRHTSFRGPTIWNDIPKDFKLVNYFGFCRLQINYLIEHPHILYKLNFSSVIVVIDVARRVCAYVLWLCLHRHCLYMYRIL